MELCSLNVRENERNNSLGQRTRDPIFRPMCGRVRLSSDVSEIKLILSIRPSGRPAKPG